MNDHRQPLVGFGALPGTANYVFVPLLIARLALLASGIYRRRIAIARETKTPEVSLKP